MKRHRHTPEQVVRKLREGERLLNEVGDLTGVLRTPGDLRGHLEPVAGSVRRHEGERGQAAKELEAENVRLKKLVANQALDIDMLREVAEGNF